MVISYTDSITKINQGANHKVIYSNHDIINDYAFTQMLKYANVLTIYGIKVIVMDTD